MTDRDNDDQVDRSDSIKRPLSKPLSKPDTQMGLTFRTTAADQFTAGDRQPVGRRCRGHGPETEDNEPESARGSETQSP